MSAYDRHFFPHQRPAAAKNEFVTIAKKWSHTVGLALALTITAVSTGCKVPSLPSASGLDLMEPSSTLLTPPGNLLLPRSSAQDSQYKMGDGTVVGAGIASDGSMTMESYQKIREAKAQNAVVLQVAGDSESIRVLPLPAGEKSVFVSELLDQTGVFKKYGTVNATVYRPSPESISGIKMEVRFAKDGTIDPSSDYGLRPGDRVQVSQRKNTGLSSLLNLALRR